MIEARVADEWILRLFPGEEVMTALRAVEINSAIVLGGIGMVRAIRLGFWNGSSYDETTIDDPAELVSLQGNIAASSEGRAVHVHAVLALRDRVLGGHLLAATVEVTAEIALRPLSAVQLERDAGGLRPCVS